MESKEENLLQKIISTDEKSIKLFEKIFNRKINSINCKGIELFDTITEYDFSLYKIETTYEENEKMQMYLKMIKGREDKRINILFLVFTL